uniref:Endonuclease/exonuclease/phosphatase domain-containing protein n=1 Tax=Aegilops tauschii subsp. strangulata TaxID=200361 RepID=A0A453E5E8_AEGTS
VASQAIGQFSITATVSLVGSPSSFTLTSVYGPSDGTNKEAFFSELVRAAPPSSTPWLLNGDFNVIYEARDKNNLNLNRRMMSRFR